MIKKFHKQILTMSLNALRREYNVGPLRKDQKIYLIVKREKNGNFVSRLTVNIDNITSVHVFLK